MNERSNNVYSAAIKNEFDRWNARFNKKSSQATAQQVERMSDEYKLAKGLLCGVKNGMLDFTMESLGIGSH